METKRILMVSANPPDEARLRLHEEERTIREVLRDSLNRDRFEIRTLPAARGGDFQRELAEYKPHVVHFSGHGDKGVLGLDAGNDQTHWIGDEPLAGLLQSARSHVECVIFNACYTEGLAESVAEHIDYVVGMNDPIDDWAAIHFSRGFYIGWFAGQFFPDAFVQGILAVRAQGLPDHLTPTLKIHKNAKRDSFLPGYNPDILIFSPANLESWSADIQKELEEILALRLGSRNTFTIGLETEKSTHISQIIEKTGLILPVFPIEESNSKKFEEVVAPFLAKAGRRGEKRIFPLETAQTLLPELLQGIVSYSFWKVDGDSLTSKDSLFHARFEVFSEDVFTALTQFRMDLPQEGKGLDRPLPSSSLLGGLNNHWRGYQGKTALSQLPNKKAKVFISYATEDYRFAVRLYGDLKKEGFSPWLDREDLLPGQIWQKAISKQIKESHYFIGVFSSHSINKRGHFQKEIKEAEDVFQFLPEDSIFAIPIRLDECKIPDSFLKYHYVDFFDTIEADKDVYQEGLSKVLKSLAPTD